MHAKTRPQHPHVQIPSSTHSAASLSPTPWVPQITNHSNEHDGSPLTATPFSQGSRHSFYASPEPLGVNTRPNDLQGIAARPISFAGSFHDADAASWRFPEPQLHRSISQPKTGLRPLPVQPQLHRFSKSDSGNDFTTVARAPSVSSSRGSITPEELVEDLTQELSSMTLESEEGLRRFQAGQLNPSDEAWHRLVPETAREALGKREVERQSVIFEIFKSEKDYVADLEAIRDAFIQPLKESTVIDHEHLHEFVKEVFWNMDEIIAIHQRMLPSLFARQREQHPLVQSITDIVLETALQFQPAYESYIKHYPIAEARHRSELKANPKYQKFMQQSMQDPRIKKRDLVTFISRPVTRLPRLSLLLEHVQKFTEPDHPDEEIMPILLGILSDFIKSTQPGIAAAESKVKFWSLSEGLVFRKGEIIDMDLYHENRTLVHSGTLARRQRNETDWHGWNDIFVALLNNYLIFSKQETLSNGVNKYYLTSRPIPLQYLRLGSFDQPAENRKEKADDGRLLESLRYRVRPVYPFTVFHAASKLNRRYTFYANSEASRDKWRDALIDTMGVLKAWQDANEWFAAMTLNDEFFRIKTPAVSFSFNDKCTGPISSATAFVSASKKYLAVSCQAGVFVGSRGPSFKRVLKLSSATSLIALQDHNKLLIHYNGALVAYSLDLLARVSEGHAPAQALDASMERIAGQDGTITCVKAGPISNRMIVVYVCKTLLSTTIHALEVINPSQSSHTRRNTVGSLSFRSFGNPFYVPKQAYDITFLTKTVGIATERGIVNVDPTDLSNAAVLVVPDFSAAGDDDRIAALKARCDEAKPLGLARSDHDEILVIYEEMGCYVTRHGKPSRSSRFVRWENKATAYAHRGSHILLFSAEFIEVRHIHTGRLVQVLEGQEMRLLHPGQSAGGPVLVARRGSKNDKHGQSDEVVELVETAELATPATASSSAVNGLWDEWDM